MAKASLTHQKWKKDLSMSDWDMDNVPKQLKQEMLQTKTLNYQ